MRTTLALALMGAALISMPAVAQNAASQSQSGTRQEAKAPPLYQIKAGQWRATKLDGLDVYNTENEKIGDISELILDRSGKIQAVVIGVGGFLGIGEHLVAVPFEQVQWMDQPVERRTSANDRGNAGNAAGGGAMFGNGTSGSSTATAPPPGPAQVNAPQVNAPLAGTHPSGATADGPAPANASADTSAGSPATTNSPSGGSAATTTAPTQTRVDSSTGATVTTTNGGNAAATDSARSGTSGMTSGDRANSADRTAKSGNDRNDTTQTYRPDHAVVAMTKDQLKALPEVRYGR